MKQAKKLNALGVAGLYVGAIIGAGFASGRETWQFFGVFEGKGIWGIAIFAFLFFIIGHMIRYISLTLKTSDMGRIIVPGGNKRLESMVGYFMAAILANVLVIMTAAGSSLLAQQFNLPYWLGGIIVMVMVIGTVLGDFERLSKIFRFIMPALCVAIIFTCAAVMVSEPKAPYASLELETSPVASNWAMSAFSYTAYNVLALVSIVATASLNSKNNKTSFAGVSIGGIFLGILALLILLTVQKDMLFSQDTDMPVLGYAGRRSKALGMAYTVILFFTVYSAAAGNFYGFTTKIKDGPQKKKIVAAAAAAAYILGLIGFKNIVKYVSPVMGYLGILIILLLTCNFIWVWKKEHKSMKEKNFPSPLAEVTGGPGGMSVLIKGKEKNILHDCGMACFHKELIENIESQLCGEKLDYILLSHSHYDHMGALPYLLKRWPEAVVCAGRKTWEVFQRPGAIDMIVSMGKTAAEFYGKDPGEITAEGIRVDKILESGDIMDLGEEKMLCFETKGHTDCSMTYILKPQSIIFASESTGVLENSDKIHTSVLKSFDESLESARFLKLIPCEYLVIPHYGVLEGEEKDGYFDRYIEAAEREQSLYRGWIEQGLSAEEIFEEHKKLYWNEERAEYQPFRAYKVNTEITVKMVIKETKNELS